MWKSSVLLFWFWDCCFDCEIFVCVFFFRDLVLCSFFSWDLIFELLCQLLFDAQCCFSALCDTQCLFQWLTAFCHDSRDTVGCGHIIYCDMIFFRVLRAALGVDMHTYSVQWDEVFISSSAAVMFEWLLTDVYIVHQLTHHLCCHLSGSSHWWRHFYLLSQLLSNCWRELCLLLCLLCLHSLLWLSLLCCLLLQRWLWWWHYHCCLC